MADWRIVLKGQREAQQAMLIAYNAVEPRGGLGRAIHWAGREALQYTIRITHRITAILAASHMIEYEEVGRSSVMGRVFIDPSVFNPYYNKRPAEYGIYEHARGGAHAFYARTVDERGDEIARRSIALIIADMPGDTS